jgi:hypothetical protein
MDQYNQLMDALASYRPSPPDLLRYLRFEREFHGDDFCTNLFREDMRRYYEDEFWGSYEREVPRDEDGCILVEQAFEWMTRYMDDFYVEGELTPFVRTMRRTEAFKHELLSLFK